MKDTFQIYPSLGRLEEHIGVAVSIQLTCGLGGLRNIVALCCADCQLQEPSAPILRAPPVALQYSLMIPIQPIQNRRTGSMFLFRNVHTSRKVGLGDGLNGVGPGRLHSFHFLLGDGRHEGHLGR